jgi:hypothetical protein
MSMAAPPTVSASTRKSVMRNASPRYSVSYVWRSPVASTRASRSRKAGLAAGSTSRRERPMAASRVIPRMIRAPSFASMQRQSATSRAAPRTARRTTRASRMFSETALAVASLSRSASSARFSSVASRKNTAIPPPPTGYAVTAAHMPRAA